MGSFSGRALGLVAYGVRVAGFLAQLRDIVRQIPEPPKTIPDGGLLTKPGDLVCTAVALSRLLL